MLKLRWVRLGGPAALGPGERKKKAGEDGVTILRPAARSEERTMMALMCLRSGPAAYVS